ncbi:bifunctional L-myo-inositol-1-phosphate cytidylyltransferase/CDP-L-myo-inositol myo-inositolphosphotransferase [Candidatus Bipolaricaulota sp. J31]
MPQRARQAVILAGGEGRRMGGVPKPLLRVAGREILYRTLVALRTLGIDEVVIVINADYRDAFEAFLATHGFRAQLVLNSEPERGNGYSLHLARDAVSGRFLLLMGDHLYGTDLLRESLKGEGLVVDPDPRYVDRDEATKVAVRDGRIVAIGKDLSDPDAYDTGCFVLDPAIFAVTETLVAEQESVELSDVVRRAGLPAQLISGRFWTDVDTPADLRRARWFLISRAVKGAGDGLISRTLNRHISTRISALLVDRLSPWEATWIAFGIGILAGVLNLMSPAAAAVLYQASSILDGVDGEIARASLRASPLGAWIDSVLDRYVDILYLLALALVSDLPTRFWPVVALALLGSILVSYSTERYVGAFGVDIYRAIPAMRFLPGKRDERVFLCMVLVLLGAVRELFWVLAALTHLRVFLTLLLGARRHAIRERG